MSEPSIFLTGVSQGIGRSLLRVLAENGWRVYGTIRNDSSAVLDQIPERLRRNVTLLRLDLTDHAACFGIGESVQEPIDVFFSSAATFAGTAFTVDSFVPSALMEAFAVNVVGPLIMARALKPNLLGGARRLIVMMSTGNASLSGNTSGHMMGYRASKSALNQAVRCLAAEWVGEGFTSVALNPGWVKTQMGGVNAPLSPLTAANNILAFLRTAHPGMNGRFVNTDGSDLPW